MMRRTLSGILTALILTTAAPAVSPALPAAAASYVKTGETQAPVLCKETVKFVKKGSITYCLTSDGSQKTGWIKQSGKWYYFDRKDGHMLTGWLKLGTRKFYLKGDGSMVEGPRWYNVDGKRYYFTANGHVRSAWEMIGGKWYYRNTSGDIVKDNWILYNGKYYYLTATGATATGTVNVEGKKYTFTGDGALTSPISVETAAKARANADVTATLVLESDKKTSDKTASSSDQKDTKAEESKKSTSEKSAADKKKTEKSTSSSTKTKTQTAAKKDTTSITKVTGKLNDLPESKRKFVIRIANYVRKYAPKYGIKVYSPIIAQAIHESGWGESSLSAKYHNYFGLKCGTLWTGKSVNLSTKEEYSAGTLTTIKSNFRVYDNMEQGVKGYFEFIQLPRYSNLKGVTSCRQYLTNIKNDGYATGYQYVDHTMALVDLYDLTQFDK